MRLFRKKLALRQVEAPIRPVTARFAPSQALRTFAVLGLAAGVALASGVRPGHANASPAKPAAAHPVAAKPAPAKPAPAKSALAKPASAKPAPEKPSAKSEAGFRAYLDSLWPHAQAAGVTRATFDAALARVTFDASVVRPMAAQAEFVKPIWGYINSAVSPQRIERGREMARAYQSVLATIESRTGVDRHTVLAVWGMETSYGSFTGKNSTIRALASLAYSGNREEFFRKELIGAMLIIQEGHARPETLTGSWAGAMGQTQFMPTSFLKYAVDFDGDGRKDIWTNIPDALASTANYLASFGWERGVPWGIEVVLPQNFDVSGHDPMDYKPFAYWASAGLRRPDGSAMPTGGAATIALPAGRNGPAFLLTKNFRVIKEYNRSNAYAFGIGHLGDRIAGAGAIAGKWPVAEKPLSTAQAMDLQRNLQRMGFNVGKIDGKFGDQVTAAVRAYQMKAGLVADGYPSLALLQQMRSGGR